jgi:hypothetical protein
MMYLELFRSITLIALFSFIISIPIYYINIFTENITGITYINNINTCLYEKCSSDYIENFCIDIQSINRELYLSHIRNITENNEYGEIYKLILFSKLYGENMNRCIRVNRNFCRVDICGDYRPDTSFNNSLLEGPNPNFVHYSSDNNTILPFIPDNNIDYSSNIKLILSSRDQCYVKYSNFNRMYSECQISVFKYECFEKYRRDTLSNKCSSEYL